MKGALLLGFSLLISSSQTYASIYRIAFPDLNGTYTWPESPAPQPFDLGVRMSSIQDAHLLIEASGTGGMVEVCYDAQCMLENIGPGFPWFFSVEPGDEHIPGPARGGVDATSTVGSFFFDFTSDADFLLDGAGELNLGVDSIAVPHVDASVVILQPSTYQVSNVVLTVEGTPVPLPSAFVSFALGSLGLIGFQLPIRSRRHPRQMA